MQLTNTFTLEVPADDAWAFLLDVNQLAGCLPGVELGESDDPDVFKGRVKVRVGPIAVAYDGVARLEDRDDAQHSVKIVAEGRESGGSGSANASTLMTIEPNGPSSVVNMVTDLTIHGRVAQFGRGIMQDVSRALVKQMADCIRAKVQSGEARAGEPAAESTTEAMDGLSLMGSVVKDRTKRLLRRE